jgi:DNA-binding MarR family transcriptional regulator
LTKLSRQSSLDDMQPLTLEQLTGDVERQAAEPLQRLRVAVATTDAIHAVCDDLVGRFVDRARAAGCSWAEIGGTLGVSKQAAQQRFPARSADAWPPSFREDAQRALAAAGDHAQRLGHPYLGTEHVLLALSEQDDSLAGRVLADLDVTPSAVSEAIDALISRGTPSVAPIGVSGRVKRTLDEARREGRRFGHRCPGAEHLLLVVASDADGAAARILEGLGATQERLRDALAARLGPDADELAARLTRPRGRLHPRR